MVNALGLFDGLSVIIVGIFVGFLVIVGFCVGMFVGFTDGILVGFIDGIFVGLVVGVLVIMLV